MRVLVIGSGAREHAIVRALLRSRHQLEIFCYGTSVNPGIKQCCKGYLDGDITDCAAVLKQATAWKIQLAIIGPEAPLEKGLADELWLADIPTVGPQKVLAQIETSKIFTRDLMKKYQIRGLPRYARFDVPDCRIDNFIDELGEGNYVIKADGLMSGKGVKVAGEHLHSRSEALAFCQEIFDKNQTVIIEEKLLGQEFSFMCFADGKHLVPMPLVQDHKRAYDGDTGPNTGGMGSYSDRNHGLPFLTPQEVGEAFAINEAVFQALSTECDAPYIGILYGSFIATRHGVYVIEFNARFGDPEALNVLSVLESDFFEICQHMVNGNLTVDKVRFSNQATVCKYLVPEGYPDEPLKNFTFDVSQVSSADNLYLSSVNQFENRLVGAGGRTLAFVGIADAIVEAEKQAELAVSSIEGPMFYRKDIGTRELIQCRVDDMNRVRNS